LGPGLAAAVTLGAGGLLAFFVEPWLLLRLQGRPAHRVTAAALLLVAVELLICGWAPHPLAVVIAMLLAGPASGVACAFAQTALVETERSAARDRAAERAASRWGFAGAIGDVAAPAVLVAVGTGWRGAYFVAAAVSTLLAAVVLAGGGGGAAHLDEDVVAAPRFTLRDVLAARGVLLAALAATACTFLDEIVLGIGALYLDERFALAASSRNLVLGAWTVAALAGSASLTVAVERASAPQLLVVSGAGCGLALAGALCVDSPATAATLLVIAAFFSSWHWPLCQAVALRAAGDRPLLAGAAGALWQPLELAAPFVVAAAAGTLGTSAAMAMLLVQPVAVLAAGWGFAAKRT